MGDHIEAKARVEQAEVQTLRQELSELEKRSTNMASDWWKAQRANSDCLAAEAEALRRELRLEEQAIDGPSKESAKFREHAFRSESGLLTLLGKDVASGLRALKKQCDLDVALKL